MHQAHTELLKESLDSVRGRALNPIRADHEGPLRGKNG